MSRYEKAGVSIRKGEAAVERIRALCRSTFGPGVLGDIGAFAGGLRLPGPAGQVLLASIDGVGTKIRVAILCDRHDTIGYDLVCHSANDILVCGATPLFFLDYIAMGSLDPARVEQVVTGLARGCREIGCALIGGETAEMPGFYAPGDYDLAGAIVGVAADEDLVTGAEIEPGDALLGLPSVGLHTNGYSLARATLFEAMALRHDDPFPGEAGTVGDVLLRPHPYYGAAVGAARRGGRLRGLAHVTGGGIPGNLVRVLPEGVGAVVHRGAWPVPNVFRVLCDGGGVDPGEAHEVWNMGIGMILIARTGEADAIERAIRDGGHAVHRIGETVRGERAVRFEGRA